MGRKRNVMQEAIERADKDTADIRAQLDAAAGNGEVGKNTADPDHQRAAARARKPRGEIRYSVYGTPRGQDAEEYVQSLPTITQVNKWLVASAGMISKLYSAVRIVAEKTRLRANFGDRPLTTEQMIAAIGYTPRSRKS